MSKLGPELNANVAVPVPLKWRKIALWLKLKGL